MTVGELVDILNGLDSNMEIILQKDGEGNGYSPLCGADPDGIYIPDSTWSGDVYDSTWTKEEHDMEDEEWQEILDKPRVLVLHPIN